MQGEYDVIDPKNKKMFSYKKDGVKKSNSKMTHNLNKKGQEKDGMSNDNVSETDANECLRGANYKNDVCV